MPSSQQAALVDFKDWGKLSKYFIHNKNNFLHLFNDLQFTVFDTAPGDR